MSKYRRSQSSLPTISLSTLAWRHSRMISRTPGISQSDLSMAVKSRGTAAERVASSNDVIPLRRRRAARAFSNPSAENMSMRLSPEADADGNGP